MFGKILVHTSLTLFFWMRSLFSFWYCSICSLVLSTSMLLVRLYTTWSRHKPALKGTVYSIRIDFGSWNSFRAPSPHRGAVPTISVTFPNWQSDIHIHGLASCAEVKKKPGFELLSQLTFQVNNSVQEYVRLSGRSGFVQVWKYAPLCQFLDDQCQCVNQLPLRLQWDAEKMWCGALRNKTSLMGRVESRPISVKMSTAFGGLGFLNVSPLHLLLSRCTV